MPDAGVTIEIKGLDEAIKKLDKLGQLRKVHAGIRAAGEYISGLMTVYPAQTIANSSSNPSGQWYQRGWGVRYKGGGGRQTSERLDTSWSSKYDQMKFEARIGTNVSYAMFVQGPKGTQAKALKRIGWKGIDVIAKKETKRVGEMVFQAVKRAIDSP